MEWLAGNWIWIVLIGGMFAMHLFGHGGHGGHGGRGGRGGGHGGGHGGHGGCGGGNGGHPDHGTGGGADKAPLRAIRPDDVGADDQNGPGKT